MTGIKDLPNDENQTYFVKNQQLEDSVFISQSGQTEESGNKPTIKKTELCLSTIWRKHQKDTVKTNCEDNGFNTSSDISSDSVLLEQPNLIALCNDISSSQQICMKKLEDKDNMKHKYRKMDYNKTEDIVFTVEKLNKSHLDQIASNNELPITCKKNHAILHKEKLGSGKRGKCIIYENQWYTPSEFENLSGLKMSRDWRRSLRYAGKSMQVLINAGSLRPHAATCTCAICCDDKTLTGPVRYFTPNAKRKRITTSSITTASYISTVDGDRPRTAPPVQQLSQQYCLISAETSEVNSKNIIFTPPTTFAPLVGSSNSSVNEEVKSLLEALVKNEQENQQNYEKIEKKMEDITSQLGLLRESIKIAKKDCVSRKNSLLEKITVLGNTNNSCSQGKKSATLQSKALNVVFDEKLVEDIQDEEDAADICCACGIQANSECTGCRKATYCSTECQEKDWNAGHKNFCRQLASQS